jgi:hypothetical protein
MLKIIKAEYLEDYKIKIEFDNNENGIVNLSEILWGPIFEPLKDINEFKKFKISKIFNTIVWDNGADVAPEYLYEILKKSYKSAA